MERENFVPVEFTGHSSYSRGMAENGGGSAPESASSTPIEAKTEEIAGKLKGSGIDIDDRGMETVRKMAELGINPIAGGSDDEPDGAPSSDLPPSRNGAPPSMQESSKEDEEAKKKLREELKDMGIPNPEKKHRGKDEPTPEDTVDFFGKIKSGAEVGGSGRPQGDKPPESEKRDGKKAEDKRREEENGDDDSVESNREFVNSLLSHLKKEEVQKQLILHNPTFTSNKGIEVHKDVEEFAKFIEKIIPGRDLITFADIISKKEIPYRDKDGSTKKIELSDESRKLLFEWAMNRIITIPNADPDSPYELSFELSNYRDKLKAMAQSNFRGENDREFHARISGLASIEATFHNVSILIASGSEKYEDLFKSLRTTSLDFINNDIAGVTEVINEFDRSFILEVSQNSTALRTPQTDKAIQRARKTILELYKKGKLKDGKRIINEWEMERALRLGETFFRASQRAAVYTTAGDITGIYESVFDEYAARQMAPAKMLWRRFWYQKPASAKIMDRTIENMEEQWDEKAAGARKDKSELGQTQVQNMDSLMGLSRDEMFYNYLGIFDVASHTGVRGPKLYLSPIKMENGTKEGQSMYDFLYGKSMTKITDQAKLDDIETKVLGQTSYLSALHRHTGLSTELRAKIWRKRAVIDPVAVASLRPEILKDLTSDQQAAWEKLRPILDEYHLIQLADEKTKYSGVLTNKEMTEEADKFREDKIDEDVRYQILNSKHFREIIDAVDDNGNPLYSAEEKEQMESTFRIVVDRGIEQAEHLAINTSTTRHNYAIDDAPIVAWYEESGQGLNDNNFVRNFQDQHNLAANGYGVLNAVVDDPKVGADGEVFDNAVKGFAAVFGDGPSRELVEGMMRGWIQMAEQYTKTKWFPTMHGLRGKARSELEEYFGNVGIYWSESDVRKWLEGRAYKGTIENELSKPRSERRLNQLKGKEGADRKAMIIESFREDFVKIVPLSILAAIIVSFYNTIKEAFRESAKDI